MKTPRHQIASVLADRSLQTDFNSENFSRSVAGYLLHEGRTGELNSLLRDVMRQRTERGIVEVVAVSAHELSADAEKNIRDIITELYPSVKKVIISPVHDSEILGGIRLELPDRQLDLSVRGKLNRFKQLTMT